MNEFIEQCRRQWKRLGVRGAVADEMAAELVADLREGGSPEDVLGSDAADARSFAAAWARERGVIPNRTRNPRVIVPIVAVVLALAGAAGVTLMLTGSPEQAAKSDAPPLLDRVVSPSVVSPARVYDGPPLHVSYTTGKSQPFTPRKIHKKSRPAARNRGPSCFDAMDLTPTPCVSFVESHSDSSSSEIESSGVNWAGVGLGLTLFGGISLMLLASAWIWSRTRRSRYAMP